MEKIKERHEQGLLDSKEFLSIVGVDPDVLEAEQHVIVSKTGYSKAALTELFQQVKNADTPVDCGANRRRH